MKLVADHIPVGHLTVLDNGRVKLLARNLARLVCVHLIEGVHQELELL